MNSPTPGIDRSDQHDIQETNPLWMVVIALACLFSILACLVAG